MSVLLPSSGLAAPNFQNLATTFDSDIAETRNLCQKLQNTIVYVSFKRTFLSMSIRKLVIQKKLNFYDVQRKICKYNNAKNISVYSLFADITKVNCHTFI